MAWLLPKTVPGTSGMAWLRRTSRPGMEPQISIGSLASSDFQLNCVELILYDSIDLDQGLLL